MAISDHWIKVVELRVLRFMYHMQPCLSPKVPTKCPNSQVLFEGHLGMYRRTAGWRDSLN